MPRSTSAVRLLLVATLAFSAANASDADDPFKDARVEFTQAYAHASGTPEKHEPDSDDLRTYPLYPYLQSARLRSALTDNPGGFDSLDQRAATFLTYYDAEPVSRDLLRTWLSSLAERQQWPLFLEYYRESSANDALRCQNLTARIATGRTENLEADIAARWLTPQSLPECEMAFNWLRERGRLSAALVEQRVRLALDKGNTAFARQIIAQLPAGQTAPLLQWAAILDNPQRGIDALIASPKTPVDPDALLAGWTLLARRDRPAAVARYDALMRARRMDEKVASPFALALALALSWDRDTRSLDYFAKVKPEDFDDTALEWQARAALWAQDWSLVSRSINAMSVDNQKTTRWRYRAARAAEEVHDDALATPLYRAVMEDDNYYSAMAAARLDETITPHPRKVARDAAEVSAIAQLPAFVRARELLRVNLRRDAGAEWQAGFDSLREAVRPQTVHLAADWNWFDQAVATATQLRIFNDYALLYPQPFDDEVRSAAKLTQVDQTLIYSVLRQESLYRRDALSPAGAYGLLQLLPATARRTAQHWDRRRPSTADLFNPAVNVTLGAGQLRMLMDRFSGQTAVALAGYNAGPGAATRWLPSDAIDPDIWIENIPYNETRNYVQRVLWHSVVFAWLRSGDPQRTDGWLARISSAPDPAVLGTL
jgi:soluble lytic murein transglycosylase